MSWWSDLLPHEHWMIAGAGILTLIIIYCHRIVHYRRLLNDSRHQIHLAPIAVKGGIVETLGARTVELLLREQVTRMQSSLRTRVQPTSAPSRMMPGLCPIPSDQTFVEDFQTVDLALQECLAGVEIPSSRIIDERLVFKVGSLEIPAKLLAKMVKGISRRVPIPYRAQYHSQVIHLSLTGTGSQVQILVHRQLSMRQALPNGSASSSDDPQQSVGQSSRQARVLVQCVPVEALSDLSGALRDAAFMILECRGAMSQKWLSMRHLADGIGVLDIFRRTGDPRLLDNARAQFRQSAEADEEFALAWYYYGSLLLIERTRESIRRATTAFKHVLNTTEDLKLKAFAYTGLANCCAQQVHRLAVHDPRVLGKAKEHIEHAMTVWGQSGASQAHPWILATRALVDHVDERGAVEERLQRFRRAARIYLEAIQLDPDNAMFHNNLGWVFLKMGEWGITELSPITASEETSSWEGDPLLFAERSLRRALDLHPQNKLSHANLCLLYAMPSFRAKDCLDLCWFHGKAAVTIDPHYINGHRDLAVSLIRYGQLDAAFVYFQKALILCGDMEKAREMTSEVVRALCDTPYADERAIRRWQEAALQLVTPNVS